MMDSPGAFAAVVTGLEVVPMSSSSTAREVCVVVHWQQLGVLGTHKTRGVRVLQPVGALVVGEAPGALDGRMRLVITESLELISSFSLLF